LFGVILKIVPIFVTENGSIAEQLPQVSSDRTHHEEEGPSEQHEDWIEDNELMMMMTLYEKSMNLKLIGWYCLE